MGYEVAHSKEYYNAGFNCVMDKPTLLNLLKSILKLIKTKESPGQLCLPCLKKRNQDKINQQNSYLKKKFIPLQFSAKVFVKLLKQPQKSPFSFAKLQLNEGMDQNIQ